MADTHDPSRRLWNEARFNEFYHSGEPETTSNYPLLTYYADVKATYLQDDRKYSLHLQETVTDPGQILIVENTDVSCACIRDCSPHTETSTALLNPPLDRIPRQVHEHLAQKFARVVRTMQDAGVFSNDALAQFKSIEHLDARQQPPPVIPANLKGSGEGLDLRHLWEKWGPWNEEGAKKTLDYERVWNIIANSATCFKVRSKSRGQPSQVETCDLWGMWIMPSFINHSCAPNCHAMRVGDAIIIRAAKAIAAGTELTLPYFDVFQPLRKRELAAQKWGFRCMCTRCSLESNIGKPYDDIQEQIVNLERQIQRSSVFKDEKQRRALTDNLLEKLAYQYEPMIELARGSLGVQARNVGETVIQEEEFPACSDCICASFSEALIARYAVSLREAYKNPFPQVSRTAMAKILSTLCARVWKTIEHLNGLHPGSLICQELYSILIKLRNEIINDDLDENERKKVPQQKRMVTRANKFSRHYYGSNVKVFESLD